jgi:hypothetical protein
MKPKAPGKRKVKARKKRAWNRKVKKRARGPELGYQLLEALKVVKARRRQVAKRVGGRVKIVTLKTKIEPRCVYCGRRVPKVAVQLCDDEATVNAVRFKARGLVKHNQGICGDCIVYRIKSNSRVGMWRDYREGGVL